MIEEWRGIPGFDGYEVSNLGRVRSYFNNRWGIGPIPRILAPWVDRNGYLKIALRVQKRRKPSRQWVHRLVVMAFCQLQRGQLVDHVNGDPLDNRVDNLRPASTIENARNSGPQRGSSSAYKGVSWLKQRKKWYASIGVDGRTISLGKFDCEIDAASAYDDAARKYFGQFARLNFPVERTGGAA